MSVFRKLFAGDDKPESNTNSENLTDAYDSLTGDTELDPDNILGVEDALKLNDADLLSVSDTDRRDETDGVFDVQIDAYDSLGGDTGEMDLSTIEATAARVDEYISNISEENYAEDDADYYEDTEESEEGEEIGAAEEIEEPEVEEPADNNVEDEYTQVIERSADDMTYAAYAPKNMRPQITQRSYYDLDDIENDDKSAAPSGFKAVVKKHAKLIAGSCAAAVVVVGIIVGCIFLFSGGMDPLMGYTATNAVKGNVIKTMAAGGNVEPNARYEITSLVNGTVTESPLNAGEEVKAGELVYKVDDTNAQLAVQMAENAVERAKVSGSSSSNDNLKIYANASGTISDLKISSGSTLTGGQIATITQSNGTEIGLIPSVTGTVQSVNVRNGSTVSSGQVIATLKSSSSNSSEGQKLDVEGSELALEQAQKELEKYKIASPVDGTILVKNAKIGDNVTAGKTDKPLMVIADMSKMKFTIEVDELDIWNIQLSQTVVITANALPGETFSGEITNIAGEGEKKGDGVTVYAVEITISDPGKIKSGMNVDAKIILNSAINAITLPENALYESDGKNALVITNSSAANDKNTMNAADYPHITVPDGYKLVKVEYGVSDGTNVEIISGLSVGDVVLYKADAESSLNTAPQNDTGGSDTDSSQGSSNQSGDENSEDNSVSESFGDQSRERSDNLKSTGKSALQDELDI